jgi:hypothetical protein
MKAPGVPTPRPGDAEAAEADPDVLPADPVERSLTVEFIHLNSSTHPDAGAARGSILRIIEGVVEGRRRGSEAVETERADDADAPAADAAEPGYGVFVAMARGSTASAASPKKRIGRPPTNGIKPPIAIVRTLQILKHFEAHRALGHTDAIAATVKAIKEGDAIWPGMKRVSTAEVKRVLATCQPVGRELAFRVAVQGNGGALRVAPRLVKRIKLG